MILQLLLLTSAGAAENDAGVDYELFKPHADFFGYSALPGAATLQNLQLGASLWFDYSDDPVILVDVAGNRISPDGTDADALVGSKVGAHAQIGIGLTRFGSIAIDVPLIISQDGFNAPVLGDATPGKLAVAGIGDLVIAPKVVVLDRNTMPLGLAVTLPVAFPTGDATQLMGEGAVSLSPQATLEWSDAPIHTRGYKIRVAGTGGALIREPARIADSLLGNAFLYGIGAGFHVAEPIEITAEFHGMTAGERTSQNPAELLIGGKALIGDVVTASLGGGTGLFGGVGAPDFRIYAGVGIAPSIDPANRDSDRDNIADGRDKCPNDAEDADKFQDADGCPELDNDADGREDTVDECPDDPEDDDGFMDNDGCPEKDNDKDGVLDPNDQCPNEIGSPDTGGCPNRDTDGDSIGDDLDRCPYDAEDLDGDRDEDGCPDEGRVVVEKNFIRINDLIYFDTGKATIQERSYDLLDEIAKVLIANDQLLKVRVEGHTDDVGNDISNLKLSQARAESVAAYLQTRGVEAGRLDAAGFGEMRPLVPNENEDGRAKNRRVEFIIVDQK